MHSIRVHDVVEYRNSHSESIRFFMIHQDCAKCDCECHCGESCTWCGCVGCEDEKQEETNDNDPS
jgi:hypothetical protein